MAAVRALLEGGADPNPASTSGVRHSLLFDAASRDDGAATTTDGDGWVREQAEIVAALLRAPGGGDGVVNECTRSPDQFGFTPLHAVANAWASAATERRSVAHCRRMARDLIVQARRREKRRTPTIKTAH